MTSATSIAVLLALSADGRFPLAAAFVLGDGGVVIASMESGRVEPVATQGLHFTSVDISPNRKTLVGVGRSGDTASESLYSLSQSEDGNWATVSLKAKGAPRTPRFTPSGKSVVLAASAAANADARSPTQLWRIPVSSNGKATTSAQLTKDADCHFSPSPLDDKSTAQISTNCVSEFSLSIADADGLSTKLERTHAAYDEVAASFDGKSIVVVRRLDGQQVFELRRGSQTRVLYAFKASSPSAVQPKFVCPRDLMFLENGVPKVLNTQDGGIRNVEEIRP